ncbi:glycosyltransferase family 2 protein [Geothermobacter hydrogeniphilus]|nr:glycosyltransferase family 2 protein [Geothermobacter hydrogeniphilus]
MISVCLASHNGEKYIRRQLESILAQLVPTDEVVVSDDSSTDATLRIVQSLEDPRIRLFPGNTFFSPVYNFEHALKQARGDVIILADQDDVWLENRVALVREKFRDPPHARYLLVTDGAVVDEREQILHESIFRLIGAGPGFWKNLWNNRYMGCCMAFSRELLEVALPFPRHLPMHDMWLGQLCERIGVTEFVPVRTLLYRKHADSQTEFQIRWQPWLQIRRRWILATNLMKRSRTVLVREECKLKR